MRTICSFINGAFVFSDSQLVIHIFREREPLTLDLIEYISTLMLLVANLPNTK